jgi:hypothetical protein
MAGLARRKGEYLIWADPAIIIGAKMRDLLFKNLTSNDRKRRIIASSEIVDKQGVRSIIRRHFICMVKEIENNKGPKPLSQLYVLKEHNSRQQKERFYCRIKGSIWAVSKGRLFMLLFMHSLRINLLGACQDPIKYNEEGPA